MPSGSVVVTGATGSMGRAATRALLARGESVVAVARDCRRAEKMREELAAEFPGAKLELALADLSTIASVRNLAESLAGREIKALFNNAGTLLRDYTLTADGLESCVAINYVAPFILCERLCETIPAGGHIVNMVSLTTRFPKIGSDFFSEAPERYSQLGTYARSKLALMLYSVDLAARRPELRINVADPGVVNSNMIRMDRWFDPLADVLFRPLCKTPEEGVAPALRALGTETTGKLFVGRKIKEIPSKYRQFDSVGWLRKETLRIVGA